MNVDFATGMKGLIPNELRKRWSNKKLDEKSYCSTFMLYLGVDKKYDLIIIRYMPPKITIPI